MVFSGAGSIDENQNFFYSEKAIGVRRMSHVLISDKEKVVFETFHIWKGFFSPGERMGFLSRLRQLFSKHQRLQIGLSDANRSQFAEYLKVGTTALLVEMADAGWLDDAPRFRQPIAALKRFNRDGDIQRRAMCRDGVERSAIEIQEWYLARAREYVRQAPTVAVDVGEILRLWSEVICALRQEPGRLLGRVDWVGKKYLLATAGKHLEYDALKKIDLKYHELGTGYFDLLEERGIAPTMFSGEQVAAAVNSPPQTLPARIRSRFIQSVAYQGKQASVSWKEFKIEREDGQAEVVSFTKFAQKREQKVNR
jgi:proteasome accessory factor A